MLGIDEGADAAVLLGFGDHVQRECRLARAFRPEYFDDSAARQPTNPKRDVEAQRAGGDRFDLLDGVVGEAHDRAFTEISLDLAQRGGKRLVLVHYSPVDDAKRCGTHWRSPYFMRPGVTQRARSGPSRAFNVLILFSFCFQSVNGISDARTDPRTPTYGLPPRGRAGSMR